VKEMLEDVIEKIEKALGDYSLLMETDCPEWALSLKEAEGKVIEAIERIEAGGINERLEKPWGEFCLWDCNAQCKNDDDAEKYARYKGATGHKIIAFMAFAAGYLTAKKEAERETGN
jgi:hypothetical protein